MTQSQSSSNNEITEVKISNLLTKFKDQREAMKLCVGYTFTQETWDQARAKFKEPDTPIDKLGIGGAPVFICTKQKVPMIGWTNKEAMMAFIALDGDVMLREEYGTETRPGEGPGLPNEDEG